MKNLDKIIELTHGKWPEDPVLLDGIYTGEFTKQQYMQRLKESTARPDVKDWPEWADYCAQDASGKWHVYASRPKIHNNYDSQWSIMDTFKRAGKGNTITTESWKNSLISREEAEMVDNQNKKWIPDHGTECEYRTLNTEWMDDQEWEKVELIGRKADGSIVLFDGDDYFDVKEEYAEFRPIQTAQDKIEFILNNTPLGNNHHKDCADKILNAIKSGEIKID